MEPPRTLVNQPPRPIQGSVNGHTRRLPIPSPTTAPRSSQGVWTKFWTKVRSQFRNGPRIPAPVGTDGRRNRSVRTTDEVVAAHRAAAEMRKILGRARDDQLDRVFDDKTKEAMLLDPAAAAAVAYLQLSIVEQEVSLAPPAGLLPLPGRTQDMTPEQAAKIEQANEVAEFCRRQLDRMDQAIEEVILEMSEFLVYGSSLAEIVYEYLETGVDQGKLGLRAIRVKPRPLWQFVVDAFNRVVGIHARIADGTTEILPPSKFCWVSWRPRAGDPRGLSILRPGYAAWHFKTKVLPSFVRWLDWFGGPAVVGKLGESGMKLPDLESAEGSEPAEEIDPGEEMLAKLEGFRMGFLAILNHDEEIELTEAKGNGDVFRETIDATNREIVLGILCSIRAILESKYGSRADSQTAQDVTGLLVRSIRRSMGRMIEWKILWPLVAYNFGPDIADEATPDVSLGSTEHQDRVAFIGAVASLGYKLTKSQMPAVDAELGFPVREMDEEPEESDPPVPPSRVRPPDEPGEDDEDEEGMSTLPGTDAFLAEWEAVVRDLQSKIETARQKARQRRDERNASAA